MGELPSYRELSEVNGRKASWGVWGGGGPDYFGCLNLQTPDRLVAAAGLVQRGAMFPLNWSMRLPDPPLFNRARFDHEVTGSATSTSHDDVLRGWNTQSSSQWDGFRHVRNEPNGHYGGVPDDEHGMSHWAERGIAGRAVLADVGRYRAAQGRAIVCDAADPIEASDVVGALDAQGTELREGDVLLLRTGWVEWYETLDHAARADLASASGFCAPGLRPGEDTAEFLWDLHIAAIGCDNPAVEMWPPGAAVSPEIVAEVRGDLSRLHEIFCHTLLLPMLGLPLGELWNLGPLAADCAADGRYECMFVSAPLNLPSGVASPPNAIAIK